MCIKMNLDVIVDVIVDCVVTACQQQRQEGCHRMGAILVYKLSPGQPEVNRETRYENRQTDRYVAAVSIQIVVVDIFITSNSILLWQYI